MSDPQVWLITGEFPFSIHHQHITSKDSNNHDPLGTSTGFGRRLVSLVLERGDRVIATARSIQRIEDLPQSPNLHLLELDVDSGTDTIKQRVDEAAKVWGGIDVLVNNAGVGWPGLLEECGYDIYMFLARTSLMGVMLPISGPNYS
jgi:NADP-dependent 3-hydroxy acid dehydrogenase YdfG